MRRRARAMSACLWFLPSAHLAVIERSRRGTVLQARERGEVAGPHQPPIEPSRAVVVAADPAGVTWCRGETGDAGQPIDGLERS